MSSPGKKWRLKVYPTLTYRPARSMRDAYAQMLELREQYEAGTSNTHQVNIEVDEGLGRVWETFEVCDFPARDTADAAVTVTIGQHQPNPADQPDQAGSSRPTEGSIP